ncbi:MAG: energy-coupled thiamine transporter ThiT [Anaerovoracaceae bacterium]
MSGRFAEVFFQDSYFSVAYAPEGMSPVLYSFLYQLSYIGVEGVITVIVINIPVVKNTLIRLKSQLN